MNITLNQPITNIKKLSKLDYINRLDDHSNISLYYIICNEIQKYHYMFWDLETILKLKNTVYQIIISFYQEYSQTHIDDIIDVDIDILSIVFKNGYLNNIIYNPIDKHKIISEFREIKLKRILNKHF